MNKAEIISRHAQALKGQVGTSLAIDECEDIMASMFYEAINFIRCCETLKDKKAITYEQYRDFIYTKDRNKYINKETQMPTYEDEIELRYEWHLKNL